MNNTYLILVVVFILSLSIRTGYELLKNKGRVDLESKLIFGFIFTTMCALWVCWFSLCPADPFRFDAPGAVRWIGLGLFAVGMMLAVGALLQLRGLENIDHLVTSGLFAKIRHPMYTGFMLWIVGWSAYNHALVSLIVGLIGIVHILFWRRWEEARLLARYGETYHLYRLNTWF